MIAVLLTVHRSLAWWIDAALTDRVVWLAVSVTAGAGVYFVALVVLGLRPSQLRMRHE